MGLIYRIHCTATKQNYVGQTVDGQKRWVKHINDLRIGKHHSYKLQDIFWKYGESNLRFEVLEDNVEDVDLTNREAYWMKEHKGYGDGLNVAYVGHPSAKPTIPYAARTPLPAPPLSSAPPNTPPPPITLSPKADEVISGLRDTIMETVTELRVQRQTAEDESARLRAENESLIRENAVLLWRLGERDAKIRIA